MRSRKLVWCCIAGIVLGFLAPMVFHFDRSTSLSVGLVAGLGIGYLLDVLDEKKQQQTNVIVVSEKAQKANRLMEQARAELNGTTESKPSVNTSREDQPESDISEEEQAAKLSEAEELLRKARERMKK